MVNPLTHKSLKNVSHGFFTRIGGYSKGIYAGLNAGLGSDDQKRDVIANRDVIRRKMKADVLCSAYQIHSSSVAVIDGRPWDLDTAPDVDAIVTNQENILIGVLTADCGPVLFSDKENGVVGCAHAGWKGAIDGVLENTVKEMVNLGAKRKNIVAVLGPCIAQKNYEVGDEFKVKFCNVKSTNSEFFKPNGMRYLFDLKGYIESRLKKMKLAQVSVMKEDTYADEKQFYSYRRAMHNREPDYGRQISTIMLG